MSESNDSPKKYEAKGIEPLRRPVYKTLHEIYPEMAGGAEVPDGPLGLIKLYFANGFEPWGISLPEEDVVLRRRGKINEAGWTIWCLFGEDDAGEYIDYYSAHRMTNDSHTRVYEDGRCEGLGAMPDFRVGSADAEEDTRLEKEWRGECLRVAKELDEKGFGIEGDEYGAVQIRRYQQLERARNTPED